MIGNRFPQRPLRTGTPTPTNPNCRAPRHCSRHAYRYWGCRCPEAQTAHNERTTRTAQPRGHRRHTTKDRDPHVDQVAVDRAMTGDTTVALTIRELGEAITRLTQAGRSARDIAIRLGITQRTVVRHRTGKVAYAAPARAAA